jgi:F-type H+-transporting ATPase subunit a
MEEHILGITKVVNFLLGKPVAALLAALHIQPSNPEYPIPNHVSMEILVLVLAGLFFIWLKGRLSVERPGGAQQCMEAVLTNSMGVGVRDLLEENAGHGADRFVPMIGSIGLFVLFCNLISLVPGLESPTATSSVPLGCAVVVFLYYNWCGLRHHGPLRYGKTFLGPVLPMAIIMFPIEVVSHFARLLSLTVRLWVNMLVSELLYGLFLGLTLALFLFTRDLGTVGYLAAPIPALVPIVFILLHIFVGLLQAFVFTLLPAIYIGGAVAEEH